MADPAKGRPAPPAPPLWRQVFDSAERAVAPRAERLVRTSSFALGVGLVRRAQSLAQSSARDLTARAWHLVNLPAGSDIGRLRAPDRGTRPRGAATRPATGGRRRRKPAPSPDPTTRRRTPMPTVPSPQAVLDRVRRDVERNALRARNGIKLVAGVDRPGVGQTPKDVVWQRGRTQLWHYRNDNVRYGPPLLIIFSLISRSYILDLTPGNSFVEQLLEAGFDVYLLDWGEPTSGTRATGSRTTSTTTSPPASPACWSSPAPTRSTSSATASAATSPCSTPPTTRRAAAQPDRARDPGRLPAHGPARRRLLGRAHGRRRRARRRRQRAAVRSSSRGSGA